MLAFVCRFLKKKTNLHCVMVDPYLFFYLDNFQVIDDKKIQRRICVSTWQTARNKKCQCVVQIKLCTSWEHINLNLANITNTLFGAKYVETVKLKVSTKILQWTKVLLLIVDYCHLCFFLFFFLDSSKLLVTKCVFHRQILLSRRTTK